MFLSILPSHHCSAVFFKVQYLFLSLSFMNEGSYGGKKAELNESALLLFFFSQGKLLKPKDGISNIKCGLVTHVGNNNSYHLLDTYLLCTRHL